MPKTPVQPFGKEFHALQADMRKTRDDHGDTRGNDFALNMTFAELEHCPEKGVVVAHVTLPTGNVTTTMMFCEDLKQVHEISDQCSRRCLELAFGTFPPSDIIT